MYSRRCPHPWRGGATALRWRRGRRLCSLPLRGRSPAVRFPLSAYRQTMVMLSNVSAGKRNLKGKVLRFDRPDGRRGFKIDGPAGPSPLSGANTTLLHNLRRQRCPRRPVFTAICLICGMYQDSSLALRMTVSGGKARNADFILIARKGDTTTLSGQRPLSNFRTLRTIGAAGPVNPPL